MKRKILLILLSILAFATLSANNADTITYKISIVDYSLSWIGTRELVFDDEIFVQDTDNIDKAKKQVLVHRQLFGVEKNKIKAYLALFMEIEFQEEYIERTVGSERNQKRINIRYGDKKKTIFISNKYQQDVASFVTFLNNFIPEGRGMKEFSNPMQALQPNK